MDLESNNSSEKAAIADPVTDVCLLLSASYTLETWMVESKCDIQNIYQPENTGTVRVGVLCIPAEQELDLVGSAGQGGISPSAVCWGRTREGLLRKRS